MPGGGTSDPVFNPKSAAYDTYIINADGTGRRLPETLKVRHEPVLHDDYEPGLGDRSASQLERQPLRLCSCEVRRTSEVRRTCLSALSGPFPTHSLPLSLY